MGRRRVGRRWVGRRRVGRRRVGGSRVGRKYVGKRRVGWRRCMGTGWTRRTGMARMRRGGVITGKWLRIRIVVMVCLSWRHCQRIRRCVVMGSTLRMVRIHTTNCVLFLELFFFIPRFQFMLVSSSVTKRQGCVPLERFTIHSFPTSSNYFSHLFKAHLSRACPQAPFFVRIHYSFGDDFIRSSADVFKNSLSFFFKEIIVCA